jgi:hypothetical protein
MQLDMTILLKRGIQVGGCVEGGSGWTFWMAMDQYRRTFAATMMRWILELPRAKVRAMTQHHDIGLVFHFPFLCELSTS